jgi:hypothetical protein
MEFYFRKTLAPRLWSERSTFIEKVALSDREVGELRELMEKAGMSSWTINQKNDGLHLIKSES